MSTIIYPNKIENLMELLIITVSNNMLVKYIHIYFSNNI